MAMGENLLVTRNAGQTREVAVAFGLTVGGGRPLVVAGPCSVESREQILTTARAVKAAGAGALRGGAFKPRTSPYAFQGLGEEGLRLLAEAREATGLPVITEVMDAADIPLVAEYADVLQVGARNMQNYPLLKALGRVNKPVLLKRGPAATVEEWLLAAEYILAGGNDRVILCERGIRTFEQHTRNTLDLASALAARQLSNLPVMVDPSHGAGRRELVAPLAKAALAAGLDGVLVEVHPNPDVAWSDGPQSLDLDQFAALMRELRLSQPAPAVRFSPHDSERLAQLRQAIDRVDQQILQLLQERMDLALEVAREKARAGMAVYQPLRERALIEGLVAGADHPLTPAAVRDLWTVILRHSRELQSRLISAEAELA